MNKLVQFVRLEQNHTEVLMAQLEAGDEYKRKKKEVEKDEKIRKHLLEWTETEKWVDNVLGFMDVLLNLLDN